MLYRLLAVSSREDIISFIGKHAESRTEVATLVNTTLAAGNHQYVFDGSRLMSGVFFYRLTAHPASDKTSKDFTEVKKLLIF
jgi:hypothetical protein